MKNRRVFISVLICAAASGAWAQSVRTERIPKVPGSSTVSAASLAVPYHARECLLKAVKAHLKQNNAEALKQANEAVRTAPKYPEALTFRAMLEINLNRLDAALDDLEQALDVDPHLAMAYLHMGSLCNRQGRYDDALRSLNRNEQLTPATWASAFEMAKAWLGKHDYVAALAQLDRSTRMGGEKKMASSIHMMRGDALYGLGRYHEAGAELRLYLAQEPNGALRAVASEMLDKINSPTKPEATIASK